ncbi:hypothetical protein ANCDUO_25606 [Ancylostoma duodenale]|uniref:Uncharacterized protein n=1 Tax=Ancylostoma duodenale TaxID=51022 RepID=A0A0C2FCF1_9BILA|nr:hypothetical protein ANCDUO_25606 [Ancylostoma duodenale]
MEISPEFIWREKRQFSLDGIQTDVEKIPERGVTKGRSTVMECESQYEKAIRLPEKPERKSSG